jgi:trehalose/maltose transport system permease protein
MLTPMLVVLLAVAGWPLARTLWFSLTDASLAHLDEWKFIGLENYGGEYGVLRDPDWWRAVGVTGAFALLSVTLETVSGLGVALVINQPSRLRTLLRAAMLVPWAIPTVVSARIWSWMLHDQFGVVNHYLLAFGLIAAPLAWTADPTLSLFTVVMVDVWKTTPFMALLILAALQTLPGDCYEAARVDGVHPLRVFFKVTLPLIKHPLMVAVVFRLLDALRIFDLIYVLTSNSSSTISMSGFVRREMVDNGNMGYGSAASTSLFLMILVSAVLFLRLARVRLTEPPR